MRTNLSKFTFILFLTLFCVLVSNAQETNNSNKSANKTIKNDTEQDEDKDCPESGIAKLKVTFDKSGKVTKAKIVSSAGCDFFDEQTLKAAKSIKFEPAEENGEKITQVKTVAYTFSRID